jgi:hypothetical protein
MKAVYMSLATLKKAALRYLPDPLLNPLVRVWARYRKPHVGAGSTEDIFTEIKRRNLWYGGESVSGGGSTLEMTETLRDWLPVLVKQLGVKTLVDVPCGDFAWMQHVDLTGVSYVGGDIVQDLVDANTAKYGRPDRRFAKIDLAADPLPRGELLLCKDCLIHLSHELIFRAMANIKRSGIRHVLLTTYPQQTRNVDILTGDTWRLNLQLPPFRLPPPKEIRLEGLEGEFQKHIALWSVDDLPDFREPR